MRYNEIIMEQELDDKTIDDIINNCSIFLNDMKKTNGKFLYRGMNDTKDVAIIKSKDNRKPTTMSDEFQSIVDDWFKTNGFTAIRSNSLFCTSDRSYAKEFGNVYIIFPMNGFTYTWLSKAKDLTNISRVYDEKTESMNENEKKQFIDNYMKRIEPKNNQQMSNALSTGNEVFISGRCYAIKYSNEVLISIIEMLQ